MGLLDLDPNEIRQYGETLKRFAKTGVDITGMSDDAVIDLSKKFATARKKDLNEEAMNEIFKKLVSESGAKFTPESAIASKAGAALRGLGKVAEKVIPYVGGAGAALTALDLGQALSEVQDKGAAKIAEDYKNSQLSESEDTGDKLMMKMEPMERGLEKTQEYMAELKKEKQYTPEERMKLKEMLSKYRANAALRSAE
jgi:hypothetical protein